MRIDRDKFYAAALTLSLASSLGSIAACGGAPAPGAEAPATPAAPSAEAPEAPAVDAPAAPAAEGAPAPAAEGKK